MQLTSEFAESQRINPEKGNVPRVKKFLWVGMKLNLKIHLDDKNEFTNIDASQGFSFIENSKSCSWTTESFLNNLEENFSGDF